MNRLLLRWKDRGYLPPKIDSYHLAKRQLKVVVCSHHRSPKDLFRIRSWWRNNYFKRRLADLRNQIFGLLVYSRPLLKLMMSSSGVDLMLSGWEMALQHPKPGKTQFYKIVNKPMHRLLDKWLKLARQLWIILSLSPLVDNQGHWAPSSKYLSV